MKIEEVKRNLNRTVNYTDRMHGIESDYILTGCILRRSESGFFYQAELQDMKANSVVICGLEDVRAKGE